MTVSTTSSTITVAANSSASYSFPFIGVSPLYISVIYTTTTGTQTTVPTTAYTVSLNSPATGQIWGYGGTISPINPANYASGTLTITRILPLTQSAAISNQGNEYPIVTEQAIDIQCMENQQTAARTGSWRGPWSTNAIYNVGDIVVDGINGANTTNWYVCVIANTSGTWSTDLAAGDWVLMLNLQGISNPGTVAAGGDLTGNYPNPTIAKIDGTTISGVTGTGNLVFATSPTLVTPVLGVAAATSLGVGTVTATGLVKSNNLPVIATVKTQKITSTGTYTPSTGMVYAVIECWGGGGGGGGVTGTSSVYFTGGGGGGAGGYSRTLSTATAVGTTQSVTIGAAGAAGAAGNNNGGNGGATSVGSLCVAAGGSGGTYGNVSQFGQGGMGGAAGTGNVIAASGMAGGLSAGFANTGVMGTNFAAGGGGASTTVGAGGLIPLAIEPSQTAGNAGAGNGSGGSGAATAAQSAITAAGGAGTAGLVIITEYCSQ